TLPRKPSWSPEAPAISARMPARVWQKKDINPLLSTICRRGTRGRPNGGLSKGATSSIGLLLIGSLGSTAQPPACTFPLSPTLENRFQILENTIATTSPAL